MISRSFVQLVKCRWREFLREPSALFWVVFMPILWMVVLGFAFSNPKPERYGVGAVAGNNAVVAGKNLQEVLSRSAQVKFLAGNETDLERWFQRGEISVAVRGNGGGGVTYDFDKSNPEAIRARDFIDDLIQNAAGRSNPVITADNTIKVPGRRYVDFLIPGLLGLSIMTSSLFGTGMTIVANRRENLLKRYLATPMRKSEYLLSHVVGRLIVLAAEFAAVVLSGWLIFGFKIFGNFFNFAAFSILGAACFTAIALVCASRTRSIPVMGGLTNLISIPLIMLGGVFFSKSNYPDWTVRLLEFLPLTALNDGLRKIALEGLPLTAIIQEITLLGAYTLVGLIASRLMFRWF